MSLVARVACTRYEDAGEAVRRALKLLGGAEKFAARGERVLVKPNLLAPFPVKKAVTTHPAVVAATLEILLDIGAKPVVGDSPGFGGAAFVAKTAGIQEVCKQLGVKIVDLGRSGVTGAGADTYRRLPLSSEALDADRIWNLAKWKTHSMMGLTLGVKNLYGCVPGTQKVGGHMRAGRDTDAFAAMLLDLWKVLKPSLTILDGVIAMEGPGPSSGTPVSRNLILASANAPALDFEAARLSGFTAEKVPTVRLSLKNAILDMGNLTVTGDEAEPISFKPAPGTPTDFGLLPKPLRGLVRRILSPTPVFDATLCVECGICGGACPVKALKPGKPPAIDKNACIRCYCCQELCPVGAVSIPPPLFRLGRRQG